MRLLRLLTLLLVFGGGPQQLCAHQVDTVEFEFQKLEDQWRLLGEMDIAYMLPETRNVPGGLPLSREAVMKAAPEELARIRRETENTLREALRVTFAGREIRWRIEFPDFEKKPFALPEELADWALLSVRIVVDAQPGPGELKIHWSEEEQAELIILTEDSEDGEIVSVRPGGELGLVTVADTGRASATPQSSSLSFRSWIHAGYRHVLPVGLDHMLFIFGLFLIVLKWRPLLWQSLLFTLAHSITLAISVFGWVHLDQKLVEALVALSIAVIGVENLLTHKVGKFRYALVFGFGLVHGLGFASFMSDKVRGIPREKLTMPLLGFNLGVELAQITVLAASFLIFLPIRKYRSEARTVGSVIVAVAGVGWMIERLFFT
jgi:hypothetical protein